MNELSITLRIADRPYKMKIDSKEEENLRKAAKLINDKMKAYATTYSYKDKQDLLAMVSLEYAAKFLDLENIHHIKNKKTIESLKNIDEKLNHSLDKD